MRVLRLIWRRIVPVLSILPCSRTHYLNISSPSLSVTLSLSLLLFFIFLYLIIVIIILNLHLLVLSCLSLSSFLLLISWLALNILNKVDTLRRKCNQLSRSLSSLSLHSILSLLLISSCASAYNMSSSNIDQSIWIINFLVTTLLYILLIMSTLNSLLLYCCIDLV